MRGHIKKRSTWQFTIDLGLQALQRCPSCRKRYWTKDGRLKRCPKCQGLKGAFIPIDATDRHKRTLRAQPLIRPPQ
jgi:ssDNA-binding Zn-finger/Zn-ribbon topoisomerase 1